MPDLCDEEKLQALMQAVRGDPPDRLDRIDALVSEFPEDPRLHFLRGSILIEEGRLIEAHRSLSRAVAIAPDFAVARFQLGFFQLTSGEAENALETWGRLDRLPSDHYLRRFVDGLRCLIRDEFAEAIDNLREGIKLNDENPPLNRDMQLLIEACTPMITASSEGNAKEAVSETSFILSQFTNRTTH